MANLQKPKRIVIKVGTSTLTYETGKTNVHCLAKLVSVISDLQNAGHQVTLVSSGAVGVGAAKLGLEQRPTDTMGRQAAAAVGQCELMFVYDKFFNEYAHKIGQLLITKSDVDAPERRSNLVNTFEQLFQYGVVPIVNENDSVSTEELVFGDNDCLSAHVAKLVQADLLIILTDIDALYSGNPKDDPTAKPIERVTCIDDSLKALAGGSGSNRGTGGMVTKLDAAEIATKAGIPVIIMNGEKPTDLYKAIEGRQIGTFFEACK